MPRLPIVHHHASLLISIVFALLSISLYSPLAFWVLLLAMCGLAVRVVLFFGWYQHAPSKRTVNLLALLSGVTLASFSFSLGLLVSMVNLLVMACALKLMLLSRRRDILQLFVCCLFLTACGFVFEQSVAASLFYILLMVLQLLALASLYTPQLSPRNHIKQVITLSIQATPIAALLFLMIPQLPPLWKMPNGQASETGLSDTITPGDIAELSKSDELVFRATFNNRVPVMQERYWRAMSLEQFDGATWSVSPKREAVRQQYKQAGVPFSPHVFGHHFNYQVIAEPTGKQWLYGLDIAVPTDPTDTQFIWRGYDYQLWAKRPLMSRTAYQLSSYPQLPLNQEPIEWVTRLNLQLPAQGNPKTQAWVEQLRARNQDNKQFVNALMSYFTTNRFVYTLTPPPMPLNPVDAFLFEHQAGFCAHYASALAYSLRLGGIPARLVTGYQGGEALKPKVLSVYQYDAHAWVEAWLDETGWQRLDPTALVSPDRVEFGLARAVPEESALLSSSWINIEVLPGIGALKHVWSNIDYMWSRWILGYDSALQQDLLKTLLGDVTPERLILLCLTVLLMITLLVAVYYLPVWQQKRQRGPIPHYLRAVKAVTHYTQIARGNLGPIDYANLVYGKLPHELAVHFLMLSQNLVQLTYQSGQQQDGQFVNAVDTFIKRLNKQAKTSRPS